MPLREREPPLRSYRACATRPSPDAWNGAKRSGRRSGAQCNNLPRSGACFFMSCHAQLDGAARLDLHPCNRRNGTLYLGSAADLSFRIYEHKQKLRPGFTSRYDATMLVWYEG